MRADIDRFIHKIYALRLPEDHQIKEAAVSIVLQRIHRKELQPLLEKAITITLPLTQNISRSEVKYIKSYHSIKVFKTTAHPENQNRPKCRP